MALKVGQKSEQQVVKKAGAPAALLPKSTAPVSKGKGDTKQGKEGAGAGGAQKKAPPAAAAVKEPQAKKAAEPAAKEKAAPAKSSGAAKKK